MLPRIPSESDPSARICLHDARSLLEALIAGMAIARLREDCDFSLAAIFETARDRLPGDQRIDRARTRPSTGKVLPLQTRRKIWPTP